jgi:hypothetical protein
MLVWFVDPSDFESQKIGADLYGQVTVAMRGLKMYRVRSVAAGEMGRKNRGLVCNHHVGLSANPPNIPASPSLVHGENTNHIHLL